MYETFYQLSADPFRLSPDASFSFQHRTYRKAMTYMLHALQRAEGYIMVTGQPGTGKTTLVNDLIRTLKPGETVVGKIVSTQLTADELLNLVAYSFNLDIDGAGKAKVLVQLERFLTQQYQQRRRPLLIVDEAQDMSDEALEELRLITNIMVGNQQLLQVFLVGQEQLRDTVNKSGLEQLHQRVIASTLLEPLDSDDTAAYIKHRLRRVNWKGDPLISTEAYAMIQRHSQGIPRWINQICSRLFLHSCIEEKHRLGVEDVKVVVEELRQELLLPVEKQAVNGEVPWSVEQNEETYEEEPQPSAPAPEIERPNANSPPATERVEQKSPEAVAGKPLNTPARTVVSVSGPGPVENKNRVRIPQARHREQNTTHRWQRKLLASVAVLDSHVCKAVSFLRDGIGKTRMPMVWGSVGTALVLISTIVAVYLSHGDSNQVAGELEILALNRAAAQQPIGVASEDRRVAPVQPQPIVPADEELASSGSQKSATDAVSDIREQETIFAPPAVVIDEPPALELATMETSASATRLATEALDEAPTPETASDANAEQSEPVQDEPALTREASPAIASSQGNQASKAVDPVPVKKLDPVPALSQEEKIAELLDQGWRSLRQDRLMVPKNNNAYHYFQRVRKLDPENSDARAGIDQVVARYIRLAREAFNENDKKKAEKYVARGLSISPNNKGLIVLRDQMNAPPVSVVAEQPPPIVTSVSESEPQKSLERQGFLLRVKALLSR